MVPDTGWIGRLSHELKSSHTLTGTSSTPSEHIVWTIFIVILVSVLDVVVNEPPIGPDELPNASLPTHGLDP